MRGNLMECRNQVEQGKHLSLAQRLQDLVHAGDRQLAEAADLIGTRPNFFGMTTSGLECGEVERWARPAARYWLRVASTSLAKIGLISWGREVAATLPSGTEISKGIREQNQSPPWTWRKRQQNRRERRPAVRLLVGSRPGREG